VRLVDVRTSASRVRSTNELDTADLDVDRAPGPRPARRPAPACADTDASTHRRASAPTRPARADPGQRSAHTSTAGPRHDAGAPHPRSLHLDTPTTQRHRTTLMAGTQRRPLQVAPALRNDDIVDLLGHPLLQHAQPNAHAQRQQPLLRCPTNSPNASCTRSESKVARTRPESTTSSRVASATGTLPLTAVPP
jgi:hypothetical protein